MQFNDSVYKFMYAALQEADNALENNDIPVGAVIVFENKIIGRGYNQVESLNDPTAHAEMIAFTAAANYLKSPNLEKCDLYTTLEPCIMCTGAAINARIKTIYFGAFQPKYGACGSIYNIPAENKLNHKIKIYSGIYSEESSVLLTTFFEKMRKDLIKLNRNSQKFN